MFSEYGSNDLLSVIGMREVGENGSYHSLLSQYQTTHHAYRHSDPTLVQPKMTQDDPSIHKDLNQSSTIHRNTTNKHPYHLPLPRTLPSSYGASQHNRYLRPHLTPPTHNSSVKPPPPHSLAGRMINTTYMRDFFFFSLCEAVDHTPLSYSREQYILQLCSDSPSPIQSTLVISPSTGYSSLPPSLASLPWLRPSHHDLIIVTYRSNLSVVYRVVPLSQQLQHPSSLRPAQHDNINTDHHHTMSASSSQQSHLLPTIPDLHRVSQHISLNNEIPFGIEPVACLNLIDYWDINSSMAIDTASDHIIRVFVCDPPQGLTPSGDDGQIVVPSPPRPNILQQTAPPSSQGDVNQRLFGNNNNNNNDTSAPSTPRGGLGATQTQQQQQQLPMWDEDTTRDTNFTTSPIQVASLPISLLASLPSIPITDILAFMTSFDQSSVRDAITLSRDLLVSDPLYSPLGIFRRNQALIRQWWTLSTPSQSLYRPSHLYEMTLSRALVSVESCLGLGFQRHFSQAAALVTSVYDSNITYTYKYRPRMVSIKSRLGMVQIPRKTLYPSTRHLPLIGSSNDPARSLLPLPQLDPPCSPYPPPSLPRSSSTSSSKSSLLSVHNSTSHIPQYLIHNYHGSSHQPYQSQNASTQPLPLPTIQDDTTLQMIIKRDNSPYICDRCCGGVYRLDQSYHSIDPHKIYDSTLLHSFLYNSTSMCICPTLDYITLFRDSFCHIINWITHIARFFRWDHEPQLALFLEAKCEGLDISQSWSQSQSAPRSRYGSTSGAFSHHLSSFLKLHRSQMRPTSESTTQQSTTNSNDQNASILPQTSTSQYPLSPSDTPIIINTLSPALYAMLSMYSHLYYIQRLLVLTSDHIPSFLILPQEYIFDLLAYLYLFTSECAVSLFHTYYIPHTALLDYTMRYNIHYAYIFAYSSPECHPLQKLVVSFVAHATTRFEMTKYIPFISAVSVSAVEKRYGFSVAGYNPYTRQYTDPSSSSSSSPHPLQHKRYHVSNRYSGINLDNYLDMTHSWIDFHAIALANPYFYQSSILFDLSMRYLDIHQSQQDKTSTTTTKSSYSSPFYVGLKKKLESGNKTRSISRVLSSMHILDADIALSSSPSSPPSSSSSPIISHSSFIRRPGHSSKATMSSATSPGCIPTPLGGSWLLQASQQQQKQQKQTLSQTPSALQSPSSSQTLHSQSHHTTPAPPDFNPLFTPLTPPATPFYPPRSLHSGTGMLSSSSSSSSSPSSSSIDIYNPIQLDYSSFTSTTLTSLARTLFPDARLYIHRDLQYLVGSSSILQLKVAGRHTPVAHTISSDIVPSARYIIKKNVVRRPIVATTPQHFLNDCTILDADITTLDLQSLSKRLQHAITSYNTSLDTQSNNHSNTTTTLNAIKIVSHEYAKRLVSYLPHTILDKYLDKPPSSSYPQTSHSLTFSATSASHFVSPYDRSSICTFPFHQWSSHNSANRLFGLLLQAAPIISKAQYMLSGLLSSPTKDQIQRFINPSSLNPHHQHHSGRLLSSQLSFGRDPMFHSIPVLSLPLFTFYHHRPDDTDTSSPSLVASRSCLHLAQRGSPYRVVKHLLMQRLKSEYMLLSNYQQRKLLHSCKSNNINTPISSLSLAAPGSLLHLTTIEALPLVVVEHESQQDNTKTNNNTTITANTATITTTTTNTTTTITTDLAIDNKSKDIPHDILNTPSTRSSVASSPGNKKPPNIRPKRQISDQCINAIDRTPSTRFTALDKFNESHQGTKRLKVSHSSDEQCDNKNNSHNHNSNDNILLCSSEYHNDDSTSRAVFHSTIFTEWFNGSHWHPAGCGDTKGTHHSMHRPLASALSSTCMASQDSKTTPSPPTLLNCLPEANRVLFSVPQSLLDECEEELLSGWTFSTFPLSSASPSHTIFISPSLLRSTICPGLPLDFTLVLKEIIPCGTSYLLDIPGIPLIYVDPLSDTISLYDPAKHWCVPPGPTHHDMLDSASLSLSSYTSHLRYEQSHGYIRTGEYDKAISTRSSPISSLLSQRLTSPPSLPFTLVNAYHGNSQYNSVHQAYIDAQSLLVPPSSPLFDAPWSTISSPKSNNLHSSSDPLSHRLDVGPINPDDIFSRISKPFTIPDIIPSYNNHPRIEESVLHTPRHKRDSSDVDGTMMTPKTDKIINSTVLPAKQPPAPTRRRSQRLPNDGTDIMKANKTPTTRGGIIKSKSKSALPLSSRSAPTNTLITSYMVPIPKPILMKPIISSSWLLPSDTHTIRSFFVSNPLITLALSRLLPLSSNPAHVYIVPHLISFFAQRCRYISSKSGLPPFVSSPLWNDLHPVELIPSNRSISYNFTVESVFGSSNSLSYPRLSTTPLSPFHHGPISLFVNTPCFTTSTSISPMIDNSGIWYDTISQFSSLQKRVRDEDDFNDNALSDGQQQHQSLILTPSSLPKSPRTPKRVQALSTSTVGTSTDSSTSQGVVNQTLDPISFYSVASSAFHPSLYSDPVSMKTYSLALNHIKIGSTMYEHESITPNHTLSSSPLAPFWKSLLSVHRQPNATPPKNQNISSPIVLSQHITPFVFLSLVDAFSRLFWVGNISRPFYISPSARHRASIDAIQTYLAPISDITKLIPLSVHHSATLCDSSESRVPLLSSVVKPYSKTPGVQLHEEDSLATIPVPFSRSSSTSTSSECESGISYSSPLFTSSRPVCVPPRLQSEDEHDKNNDQSIHALPGLATQLGYSRELLSSKGSEPTSTSPLSMASALLPTAQAQVHSTPLLHDISNIPVVTPNSKKRSSDTEGVHPPQQPQPSSLIKARKITDYFVKKPLNSSRSLFDESSSSTLPPTTAATMVTPSSRLRDDNKPTELKSYGSILPYITSTKANKINPALALPPRRPDLSTHASTETPSSRPNNPTSRFKTPSTRNLNSSTESTTTPSVTSRPRLATTPSTHQRQAALYDQIRILQSSHATDDSTNTNVDIPTSFLHTSSRAFSTPSTSRTRSFQTTTVDRTPHRPTPSSRLHNTITTPSLSRRSSRYTDGDTSDIDGSPNQNRLNHTDDPSSRYSATISRHLRQSARLNVASANINDDLLASPSTYSVASPTSASASPPFMRPVTPSSLGVSKISSHSTIPFFLDKVDLGEYDSQRPHTLVDDDNQHDNNKPTDTLQSQQYQQQQHHTEYHPDQLLSRPSSPTLSTSLPLPVLTPQMSGEDVNSQLGSQRPILTASPVKRDNTSPIGPSSSPRKPLINQRSPSSIVADPLTSYRHSTTPLPSRHRGDYAHTPIPLSQQHKPKKLSFANNPTPYKTTKLSSTILDHSLSTQPSLSHSGSSRIISDPTHSVGTHSSHSSSTGTSPGQPLTSIQQVSFASLSQALASSPLISSTPYTPSDGQGPGGVRFDLTHNRVQTFEYTQLSQIASRFDSQPSLPPQHASQQRRDGPSLLSQLGSTSTGSKGPISFSRALQDRQSCTSSNSDAFQTPTTRKRSRSYTHNDSNSRNSHQPAITTPKNDHVSDLHDTQCKLDTLSTNDATPFSFAPTSSFSPHSLQTPSTRSLISSQGKAGLLWSPSVGTKVGRSSHTSHSSKRFKSNIDTTEPYSNQDPPAAFEYSPSTTLLGSTTLSSLQINIFQVLVAFSLLDHPSTSAALRSQDSLHDIDQSQLPTAVSMYLSGPLSLRFPSSPLLSTRLSQSIIPFGFKLIALACLARRFSATGSTDSSKMNQSPFRAALISVINALASLPLSPLSCDIDPYSRPNVTKPYQNISLPAPIYQYLVGVASHHAFHISLAPSHHTLAFHPSSLSRSVQSVIFSRVDYTDSHLSSSPSRSSDLNTAFPLMAPSSNRPDCVLSLDPLAYLLQSPIVLRTLALIQSIYQSITSYIMFSPPSSSSSINSDGDGDDDDPLASPLHSLRLPSSFTLRTMTHLLSLVLSRSTTTLGNTVPLLFSPLYTSIEHHGVMSQHTLNTILTPLTNSFPFSLESMPLSHSHPSWSIVPLNCEHIWALIDSLPLISLSRPSHYSMSSSRHSQFNMTMTVEHSISLGWHIWDVLHTSILRASSFVSYPQSQLIQSSSQTCALSPEPLSLTCLPYTHQHILLSSFKYLFEPVHHSNRLALHSSQILNRIFSNSLLSARRTASLLLSVPSFLLVPLRGFCLTSPSINSSTHVSKIRYTSLLAHQLVIKHFTSFTHTLPSLLSSHTGSINKYSIPFTTSCINRTVFSPMFLSTPSSDLHQDSYTPLGTLFYSLMTALFSRHKPVLCPRGLSHSTLHLSTTTTLLPPESQLHLLNQTLLCPSQQSAQISSSSSPSTPQFPCFLSPTTLTSILKAYSPPQGFIDASSMPQVHNDDESLISIDTSTASLSAFPDYMINPHYSSSYIMSTMAISSRDLLKQSIPYTNIELYSRSSRIIFDPSVSPRPITQSFVPSSAFDRLQSYGPNLPPLSYFMTSTSPLRTHADTIVLSVNENNLSVISTAYFPRIMFL